MRILVTGAGGFVGQHLCRHLTCVGDEVIACPGPDGPGALDVTDKDAVLARVADTQPEAIIHLAGVSSVAWSHANPTKTFIVNSVGAVNILQAIRRVVPAARLLLVGSGEMYGPISVGHFASEADAPQPFSPYAASKFAAEVAARQFAASYGVQTICARPFNHVGRGQGAGFVVPSLARQVAKLTNSKMEGVIDVGDLSPVRDFLHVDDVVHAYRLLLDHGAGGTVYNVCSGTPLSIRDVLGQLMEIAGAQLGVRVDPKLLRPVEIPWLVGDSKRLRSLGWRPKRTASEGLAEALEEAFAQ